MRGSGPRQRHQTKLIKEWLLAILRFSFTLEPLDQESVLALADGLDAFGSCKGCGGSRYFLRTSSELCAAIQARNDPMRAYVLYRFLSKIDDHRMSRALSAAIGIDVSSKGSKRRFQAATLSAAGT